MRFDAIVFDFGNTLVPWRHEETVALSAALEQTFVAACGPIPDYFAKAVEARSALWRERENSTMREVTVAEWVDMVCDGNTPAGLVAQVERTLHEEFVKLCRIPAYLPGLLERLAQKRPLAVLSNFAMTSPVEDVLERAGIRRHFAHVEVSATSGYAEPHPALFDLVREPLCAPMERTLMVGDDFFADVVGGHRAGLLTALTHEHHQGPTSDPRAPDITADRILQCLDELED